MGMTKARVFPLPVTCGGQGRGRLAPAAPCGGRWGGGVRTRTHRFGRDVLVSQEERDGGGLEGDSRALVGDRRRHGAARPCRSPPAPAPAGPSSRPRGTCTGVMRGKPSSRSAPSTRGCSGTGSDSQDPSVTCSIASPAAAAPGTPAANTSASGRRPVRPGTALGLRSSGERKGVLAAGDREAD